MSGKYFRIQSIATEFPARKKGDEDLYDLDADPLELKSLGGKPGQAERMKKMRAQAIQWWKDTGGKAFDTRSPPAAAGEPQSMGGKKKPAEEEGGEE